MPKFDVFFVRYGYAQIEAETKEDAVRIADELDTSDVEWGDVFETTEMKEVLKNA